MSFLQDSNLSPRQIYLNSKNADIYLNGNKKSSVVFTFTDAIYVDEYIDILVKCDSFVFPVSFYNVNENNNTIRINNTNYTIQPANYSVNTLRAYLNTLFSGIYSFTYLSSTAKFEITSLVNQNFTLNSCSALEILGFSPGQSYTSTNFKLTSNQIINLSGASNILVETNYRSNNIDSKTGNSTNTLLNIPIQNDFGAVNIYTNQSDYQTRLSTKYIGFLQVNIFDQDYNFINFQGCDWNLVFTLSFIVEKNSSMLKLDYQTFSKLYKKAEESGLIDEN